MSYLGPGSGFLAPKLHPVPKPTLFVAPHSFKATNTSKKITLTWTRISLLVRQEIFITAFFFLFLIVLNQI